MVYIKTSKISITHEDQEVDKLKFEILVSEAGIDYVQVDGPEEAILVWKERVEGIDSSLEEIEEVRASLPKDPIQSKLDSMQTSIDQLTLALLG